jgi:hypothetical protein
MGNTGTRYNLDDGDLHLERGEKVIFQTYFNPSKVYQPKKQDGMVTWIKRCLRYEQVLTLLKFFF